VPVITYCWSIKAEERHAIRHCLFRLRAFVLRGCLGFHQSLRPPLGGLMDFAIAGIAAVLLFAYLLYALLRPERF
jgi:K+-transporting ATPase KdpF subunit